MVKMKILKWVVTLFKMNLVWIQTINKEGQDKIIVGVIKIEEIIMY